MVETLHEGAKIEGLANRGLLATTLDGNQEKLCTGNRFAAGTRTLQDARSTGSSMVS